MTLPCSQIRHTSSIKHVINQTSSIKVEKLFFFSVLERNICCCFEIPVIYRKRQFWLFLRWFFETELVTLYFVYVSSGDVRMWSRSRENVSVFTLDSAWWFLQKSQMFWSDFNHIWIFLSKWFGIFTKNWHFSLSDLAKSEVLPIWKC